MWFWRSISLPALLLNKSFWLSLELYRYVFPNEKRESRIKKETTTFYFENEGFETVLEEAKTVSKWEGY